MPDLLFALVLFALLLLVYRATTPRNGREWRCGHWRYSHSIKAKIESPSTVTPSPKRAVSKTKPALTAQFQPVAADIKRNDLMDDGWWKTLV